MKERLLLKLFKPGVHSRPNSGFTKHPCSITTPWPTSAPSR